MRKFVLLVALVLSATLLVAGAAFAVTRNCDGGVCKGTNGGEVLDGSPMSDVIYGLGGNDKVVGRGGNDTLKGGANRDRVNGGEGDDRVRGSLGSDEVFGGPGDDLVRATDGEQADDRARDVLDCGAGVDTVYFVPGQDVARENCEIRNPPDTQPTAAGRD